MSRQISFAEYEKHNTENDLWLLIDGKGMCGTAVRADRQCTT